MNAAPAFQFYPDDFLGGVIDMTAEERGGYITLLCVQWTKGGLPDSNKKLSLIAGITGEALDSVKVKFPLCSDGLRRNERLEKVRTKLDEYRHKQSLKGAASAAARANHNPTTVEPRLNHGSNSVDQIPVNTPTGGQPDTQPEVNRNSTLLSPDSYLLSPITDSNIQSTNPNPLPGVEGGDGLKSENEDQEGDGLKSFKSEICSWFGRRPTTEWSEKEIRAAKKIKSTPEEMEDMRAYYTATINGKDIRRRDIQTLLNNWPSELDRAIDFIKNGFSYRRETETSSEPTI